MDTSASIVTDVFTDASERLMTESTGMDERSSLSTVPGISPSGNRLPIRAPASAVMKVFRKSFTEQFDRRPDPTLELFRSNSPILPYPNRGSATNSQTKLMGRRTMNWGDMIQTVRIWHFLATTAPVRAVSELHFLQITYTLLTNHASV